MSSLWRWGRRAGFAVLLVLVTLIVGGACDARRRLADLKPWHRIHLDEMTASALDDRFTFAQYQAGEERLFAQVRALESTNDPADRTPVNRYHPGSLSHPSSAGRDWNRSFETTPPSIRAGALLVHGLTDSPYSMRQVANVLSEHGVYSLSLRMPGHGTAPSGLVTATWADWLAAVRMGMRHVRSRIPEGAPLVLVGYSNGGALALKYTLDALDGRGGALPSKVILLSPMIGVTPAAGLAWWISRLGVVPYFEKANWLDVFPEYNPFKYNSFPANAGAQTAYLTRTIRNDLARLAATGQLKAIPPILTFQSIVDATVSTPAVVNTLYDQLPANGSELVLFDVNHVSGIAVFMQPSDRSLVASLLERAPRRYRRVVVTNTSADTRDVEARHAEPGSLVVERRALGLAWPPEMFSLSHVGLPFAPNDPLYGFESASGPAGLLPLGRLSPRGERGVLTVGTDTLMRLSSNPFFSFVAEQIGQWLAVDSGSVHRPGPAAPLSKRMADGKQWTTQNLNVTTVPSYCYDDADENCRRYGRLYTWESARQGCQSLGDGWRLPTNDEWQQLAKHYGGLLEESAAAGKATFAALIIGGTSGFDAVLSGGRDDRDGSYARLEAHGLYWTATETGADRAWIYNFGKGMLALNRHSAGEKKSAFAVRCVRD